MTEVVSPPVQIQTTVQIGTSDISAMMVQRQLDSLKLEEGHLLGVQKAILAEMGEVTAERCRLLDEAFAEKASLIDPLVASLNALVGGKCTLVAKPLHSVRALDMGPWALFDPYLPNPQYGQSRHRNFDQKTWESSWVLVYEGEGDDGEDDDGDESIHLGDLNHKVCLLRADISESLRAKINDIIQRTAANTLRLAAVRAEMKDIPNLERRVSAALTQQILSTQPELVRQVNAAISATGGLLLEVQQ